MSLQQAVLKQYKETYPQDKLKEISIRTGIQITRVFRILNGAEMKLKEFETFESLINKEINSSEFLKVSKRCLSELTKERRLFILFQMKQALKIFDYNQLASTEKEFSCLA